MSIELKIKSKHLALEPAIIRKEENKLKKRIEHYKMYHQISCDGTFAYYKEHPDLYQLWSKRGSLISHRTREVRNEARATYLARAFIKGIPYKVVEAKTVEMPVHSVMQSLIRMVMKYGKIRYQHDRGEKDERGYPKIVRHAEDKAKEDILNWMKQE